MGRLCRDEGAGCKMGEPPVQSLLVLAHRQMRHWRARSEGCTERPSAPEPAFSARRKTASASDTGRKAPRPACGKPLKVLRACSRCSRPKAAKPETAAVTDSGRPLARVGGLKKSEIKGDDGLR